MPVFTLTEVTYTCTQLIRSARMSSHVADINARNRFLTAQLLKLGHHEIRKAFFKILSPTPLSEFKVELKIVLQQSLSEPDFYGDFVYKFKRIVSGPDFSDQFRKIIIQTY